MFSCYIETHLIVENDVVLDVGVLCNSEDITLTLTVTTDYFNGMVYPKGLSKNSTCMTEYIQEKVGNMLTACTALWNFRLI